MKTHALKTSSQMAVARLARPSHHEISRLAYRLYEKAGKPEGLHLDHWFNAEAMVEANYGYGRDHVERDF
jgi:hypothetical protein